jgi:hypothetical protein
LRQRGLDEAFVAIRAALHADSNANINAFVDTYKARVQAAYGVTFTADAGADEWGLIGIHFARLGFQATAEAFLRWVQSQSLPPGLTYIPNSFALFRRVMGSLELRNKPTVTQEYIALSSSGLIEVFRRNNQTQTYDVQAIMTPNNLIHELGHSFSRFAGFGYQVLGSIENAIAQAGLPLTRDGMDALNLGQQLFYVDANIRDENGDNVAEFEKLDTSSPFLPSDYLLFDLHGTNFALWNRPEYTQRYQLAARVDTLLHNPEQTLVETAADAFLNWVSGSFHTNTQGTNWINFFRDNMGLFLRNATIRQIGMQNFCENVIYLPLETRFFNLDRRKLRFAPIIEPETTIGNSIGSQTRIYGWYADVDNNWFLVELNSRTLMWIIVSGIILETTELAQETSIARKINDPSVLRVGYPYRNSDLRIIIGDVTKL